MQSPKWKKGSVLVIVLWIIVILIVITTTLAQSSRLSSRLSQSYGGQCIGRWGARAGVETAINVLSEDDSGYDAFDELWHDNPDSFEGIQLEGCTVAVKVIDESGKLNINVAGKKHLMHLLEMTTEQADSIIDWRDKNGRVSSEGAEADYYNSLEYPYPIRNGPFQTVREVLFVKGVQEEVFYVEDGSLNGRSDTNEDEDVPAEKGIESFLTCYSFCRNVDALGDERINIKETKANQLQQQLGLSGSHAKWIEEKANSKLGSIADLVAKNAPKKENNADEEGDRARPIDLETFKEIADKITISEEEILPGRVNVNTAPREVLIALLEGDELLAEEIIQYRDGLDGAITGTAELLDIKTMTIEKFKKIEPFITVKSDVFTVVAKAVIDSTGLTYTARAVVVRDDTDCEIIYWYEGIGS